MAAPKRSANAAGCADHGPRKTPKITRLSRPNTPRRSQLSVFSRFLDFPQDIQYQILEHLAPGPFELRDPMKQRLDGRKESQNIEENAIRRRTLYNISTLSRSLSALTAPLLYRYIFIQKLQSLAYLLNSLTQFPERGRFVKQITYTLPEWTPLSSRDYNTFDTRLKRGHFFHGAPEYTAGMDVDRVVSWLKLRSQESARKNDFPLLKLGSVLLPIMALTPNLTNLNIARYGDWTTETMVSKDRRLEKDKLMKFLLGTDRATDTGVCCKAIYDFFIVPVRHRGSWGGKSERLSLFPPLLNRIDILSEAASSKTNLVISSMRIVDQRSRQKLQAMTEQLEQDLELPGLIPSTALGFINSPRSTLHQAMLTSHYLANIRDLDKSVYLSKAEHQGDGRESLASIGRSLDHAFLKAKRMKLPVIMHSQQVTYDLLDFFRLGFRERFQAETQSVRLIYTAQENEWPGVLYSTSGETLMDDLVKKFPCLESLEMPLLLHKDSRHIIYSRFDTSLMVTVKNLTLTTEGLWGPIKKVIDMLEMPAPYSEWEDLREEEAELVEGVQVDFICYDDGEPLKKPTSWEKKRFAVERIPPNCENLYIRDWFCEYRVPKPNRDESPEDRKERENLVWEDQDDQFETAVINDTEFWKIAEDMPIHMWNPWEVDSRVAETYAYFKARRECAYPTTWWEKFYDSSPPYCEPENLYAFTRGYIPTLFKGMFAMFAYGTPIFGNKREPPLVTELRPNLKKIVLIYTLSAELPGNRWSIQAHAADFLWRVWCHRGNENGPGWGFKVLKGVIKQGSGIDLEVYEQHVGVAPRQPVWPDWVRAYARISGRELSNDWDTWEDLLHEVDRLVINAERDMS
ncbi:hypothetical protein V8F20_003918 [Naviculisporaceae sp. PSN 640]